MVYTCSFTCLAQFYEILGPIWALRKLFDLCGLFIVRKGKMRLNSTYHFLPSKNTRFNILESSLCFLLGFLYKNARHIKFKIIYFSFLSFIALRLDQLIT